MFYIAIPFEEYMRGQAHTGQYSSNYKLKQIRENSIHNKYYIKGHN
jgi:hypothetical protein